MQRIVRILHILQLRLPSAASASFSSPTAITHLVAGSREGSFCLILFLTSDCESATHFPLPLHMCACVCLAFVCTFPLTLEQEAILPLPASASTLCQNSVYFAIYCATFVIIIAMQQTHPPLLSLLLCPSLTLPSLSPSLHALPCLEPRSWQKVCEKRQVCECLRWQDEDGKKKKKQQQEKSRRRSSSSRRRKRRRRSSSSRSSRRSSSSMLSSEGGRQSLQLAKPTKMTTHS